MEVVIACTLGMIIGVVIGVANKGITVRVQHPPVNTDTVDVDQLKKIFEQANETDQTVGEDVDFGEVLKFIEEELGGGDYEYEPKDEEE